MSGRYAPERPQVSQPPPSDRHPLCLSRGTVWETNMLVTLSRNGMYGVAPSTSVSDGMNMALACRGALLAQLNTELPPGLGCRWD